MIRPLDRKITLFLIRIGVWRAKTGLFRTVEIEAKHGRWLLDLMMRRQARDDRHHAPCCTANHWHYKRLVFQKCNCGAPPR